MAEICVSTIASSINVIIGSKTVLSILNYLHSKSFCRHEHHRDADADADAHERRKGNDGVELMQCVICLYDVVEGEVYRLLPECNHGFHVSCIDVWLQTHSSCPLCRCPVPCTSPKNTEEGHLVDALLLHFHSLMDHVFTWFLNPLGFDQFTSSLTEDYRSVL